LLAINGTVFDVTAGRNFYGPSMWPSVLYFYDNRMAHSLLRWHVREFRWARCFSGHGHAIFRSWYVLHRKHSGLHWLISFLVQKCLLP
jgi:hypothetical protein